MACTLCNKHKGTDLASIDPVTGEVVPIYHPRRDHWDDHFRLNGSEIVGLTGVGRATARLRRFLERLVPAAELDAAIEKWVAAICAAGPRAVRLQKALERDWERMSIRDAIHQGIRACAEARTTDEPARLMQAFIDRKKNRA